MIEMVVPNNVIDELIMYEAIVKSYLVDGLTVKLIEPYQQKKILTKPAGFERQFEIYRGEEKVGWACIKYPDGNTLILVVDDETLVKTMQIPLL